jgi:hypothetical protein
MQPGKIPEDLSRQWNPTSRKSREVGHPQWSGGGANSVIQSSAPDGGHSAGLFCYENCFTLTRTWFESTMGTRSWEDSGLSWGSWG